MRHDFILENDSCPKNQSHEFLVISRAVCKIQDDIPHRNKGTTWFGAFDLKFWTTGGRIDLKFRMPSLGYQFLTLVHVPILTNKILGLV